MSKVGRKDAAVSQAAGKCGGSFAGVLTFCLASGGRQATSQKNGKITLHFLALKLGPQVNEMLDLVKKSFGKDKQAGFRFVKWLNFEDDGKT